MKIVAFRCAALTTIAALWTAAFVPFQPAYAETDFGAFNPAAVLASPGALSGELLAFDMNRVVTTQMRFIRYEASAYQRKVAEGRARAFMTAHRRNVTKARSTARTAEAPNKTTKAKAPEAKVAKKSSAPTESKEVAQTKKVSKPAPKAEPKVAATRESPEPKPLPRYIAVDTVKDERASPKAKKVVMIWDTHAETLVGNNIYDVANPPSVGANTKFDTYSAQYIGAGL